MQSSLSVYWLLWMHWVQIFEDSATITDLEMGGRSSENQRYSGIMKSEFADSRLNKQIKNTHFKIIFYGLARFSSAEQTISLQG